MSLFASVIALTLAGTAPAADYRQRPPEDEIVYFLLHDSFENGDAGNDRGGLEGDRLATGYDPTAKGFFHGGDLTGGTRRPDSIQYPGAPAVWPSPVLKTQEGQG